MRKLHLSIIIFILFFSAKAQTPTNMITSNIQTHLVNKYWSSSATTTSEVVFKFNSSGSLYLYVNSNEKGYEDFYISTDNCLSGASSFDETKIGGTSTGNFIFTRTLCYVIEFYSGYQSFRIRQMGSSDWQTFYLASGFVPN